MDDLVEEALNYVARKIGQIIQLPIDMNCMNSALQKRLAGKLSLWELNDLHDKKDKLKSKLVHGYVCATRPTAAVAGGRDRSGAGAGEKQRREDRAAVRDGLVLGYTYSVLELHKEVSASGNKTRLVRLRIPPGSYRGNKEKKKKDKDLSKEELKA